MVAACAVLAAALLVGASANATPVVHPGHLAAGPHARVLYADGKYLHPRDGARVPMPPWTDAPGGSIRLLGGRASTGWVVWTEQTVWDQPDQGRIVDQLFRVRASGAAHVIYTRSYDIPPDDEDYSYSPSYALSDDGTRIAESIGTFADSPLTVRTQSGKVLGSVQDAGSVLSFSGPRLVFGSAGHTYRWTIGHRPQLLTKRMPAFADLKRHVLFTWITKNEAGEATLAHPGSVRWRAPFSPAQLSPDGSRVVGYRYPPCAVYGGCPPRPVVQIRRMSDGHVLTQFRVDDPGENLTWQGNRAVLFPEHDPTRGSADAVIVRCTVSGACTRATRWFDDHGAFSFPHTYQVWGH